MSALIWLAIVAVWGFVLIPMWLRHHDSAVEQRSADRFSTAMRVLSRRGSPRAGTGPLTRAPSEGSPAVAQEAAGMARSRIGEGPGTGPRGAADPADSRAGVNSTAAGRTVPVTSAGADLPAGTGPDAHPRTDLVDDLDPMDSLDPMDDLEHDDLEHLAGLEHLDAVDGGHGVEHADGMDDFADDDRSAVAPGDVDATPRLFGPTSGVLRRVPVDRAVRAAQADRTALVRLRRQRLFVLLTALPISVILAATLGGMWMIVHLAVDVVAAGYVLHLRRSAQTHRRLIRSRAALDRRIAAERAARANGGIRGWTGGAREHTPGSASWAGVPAHGTGYPPVRPSAGGADEAFTAGDLAHARAETVDLGAGADRAHVTGEAGDHRGGAGDDDAEGDDPAAPPGDHYSAEYYSDDAHSGAAHEIATDAAAASSVSSAEGAYAGHQPGYTEYTARRDASGDVEYVEYVNAEQLGYDAPVAYQAPADVGTGAEYAEYAGQAEYPETEYVGYHAHAEYQAEYVEYVQQAGHAEEAGYAAAAGYGEEAGYAEQTGYAEQVGYAEQAGYAEQVGYEAHEQIAYGYGGAADGTGHTAPAGGAMAAGPAAPRSGGAPRPVPRPGARPNTSRPGRVQVNPPGTHGGLIPPAAATASQGEAVAATEATGPAAGAQAPDELETLLRRHAVGS
ncbi:gephyrin-like molybdotransferase receptor GlpR [Parafrankia discariae]|uniref:gephyrin-like molybdotransferase receptor GlpR n=1 Tax=Parafrankia discariae TaxID=365528 RepID=UPI000476998C|nr:gephyrin-like molybdotransferase receptor GlpR [Parafrankia discariae]